MRINAAVKDRVLDLMRSEGKWSCVKKAIFIGIDMRKQTAVHFNWIASAFP